MFRLDLRPLRHLLVTVAFPVLVLQQDLFGTGWGVQDFAGPTFAFMISALVPALYVLGMQLGNRQASPVWLLFTLSTLVNALSSFWWTDGLTFAVKDSSGSLFLAVSTLTSLLVGKPLFRFVVREYLSVVPQLTADDLTRLLHGPVRTLVQQSTVVLFLKGLTVASVNTYVKFHMVKGSFGTEAFNQSLSLAVAVMVPVAYLATVTAYTLIFVLWKHKLGRHLTFPFSPQVLHQALLHVR
ncbi:hypothetical protein [Deinococcus cellulosilyticus]|nr:hypothetical protein [Deinococcus cellulosilyticus]